MRLAIVDLQQCLACLKCPAAKMCPTKALFKLDPEDPAAVEASLCNGCGRCLQACPFQAIFIQK